MILALDLGTHTGIARGRPGAPPNEIALSTLDMPGGGGDDVGTFAAVFMQQMKAEIEREPLDLVIFEAPYINRGAARPNVIRRTYGMPFIVEGMAHRRGIQCAEVAVATLKKEFAGHGHAEKSDMIAMAHRRGFRALDEHQADAAAAWYHAVAVLHPEHLQQYDPDFARFMERGE